MNTNTTLGASRIVYGTTPRIMNVCVPFSTLFSPLFTVKRCKSPPRQREIVWDSPQLLQNHSCNWTCRASIVVHRSCRRFVIRSRRNVAANNAMWPSLLLNVLDLANQLLAFPSDLMARYRSLLCEPLPT